jgi:hypothetical protein
MMYDRRVVRTMACGVIAAAVVACGAPSRPPVGLTVVVDGAAADTARADVTRDGLSGFAVRTVELPRSLDAEPPDPIAPVIAAARVAYQDRGDFAACRAAIDPIDVPSLLAAGRREQAARVLVWRAACAWSGLARADATAAADQLGQFGLELPGDTGAVIQDVENALIDAVKRAAKAERVALRIAGTDGRVILDGKPTGCTLPCTLDVARGDHVVAVEADGSAPAWKLVRAPAAGAIEIPLVRASPTEAGAQWRSRIGRGLPAADDIGLRLIARAAGDVRVAYVDAGRTSVRGALVVDGAVKARGTRDDGDVAGLLGDLTVRGGLVEPVPLVRQPRFWIVLTLGVATAAAITTLLVFEPQTNTGVEF